MDGILVVLTSVPDEETGTRIARAMVEDRLAACVSLIPGMRSFYWWQGQVQSDAELLLVAKIREDRADAYEARMRELHPYDVPEIVALPVAAVHEPYLRWALQEGSPRSS